MHELSVARSILDLALAHASRAGASRVTAIRLTVGDLTHLVDGSVQFYWDILSQGTPAEGARLHITRDPLRMECRACGTRFHPDGSDYRCPACSEQRVRVAAGDDLRMDSIDVDLEGDVSRKRSSIP